MGFYTFGPLLAIDAVTLAPAVNVTATVTDAETLATVTTYTMAGVGTSLTTNRLGYVGQFQADDTHSRLRVAFGTISLDVIAQEVIDATGDVAGAVDTWLTANPPTNPAFATSAEVAAGTETTKTTSPATIAANYMAKGSLVLHVDDFGAVGDGTTNDAAAIQSAIDAATGGTVVFGEKTYSLGPTGLTLTHGTTLAGTGARVATLQPYQHATWTDGTAYMRGTVLRYTGTGTAVYVEDVATANGASLRDLVIVGAGAGTGLKIGNGGLGYPVRWRIANVAVANFATGWWSSGENGTAHGLYLLACNIGADLVYPFNGNTITGLDVERCETIAVRLTQCDTNTIMGGVIQGNYGEGMRVEGGATGNLIAGIYFENIPGGDVTFDDLIIGGPRNEFRQIHLGSSATGQTPRVTIGGDGNTLTATGGLDDEIDYALTVTGSRNLVQGLFVGTTTVAADRSNRVNTLGEPTATILPLSYTGSAMSVPGTVGRTGLISLTGSGQTVTLPALADVPLGWMATVKNASASTSNAVAGAGGSTIDGAASRTLAAWECVRLTTINGTSWVTV